jgi:hypothetical protein
MVVIFYNNLQSFYSTFLHLQLFIALQTSKSLFLFYCVKNANFFIGIGIGNANIKAVACTMKILRSTIDDHRK